MGVAVDIRVYKHDVDVDRSHAYILGSHLGGLSDALGTVIVDERVCTMLVMRNYIEYGARHPDASARRSLVYREVLFDCENSTNVHGWDATIANSSYRLAFLPKHDDTGMPQLIPLEIEPEINLVSFLRTESKILKNQHSLEIVVIPTTQVGPGCNNICTGCDQCLAANQLGSTAQVSYFLDGKICTSKCTSVLAAPKSSVQDPAQSA